MNEGERKRDEYFLINLIIYKIKCVTLSEIFMPSKNGFNDT